MDKSIVVVEESHKRNGSLASASKCSGSLVQINSIAIDINCAMEMEEIESPKHEHFSIRGFVSEMRKKDRKMCLPFASEGDDNYDMDLPPLSVPKFRWWQCPACVPVIADQRSTLLGMILADHKSDISGTSSYDQTVNGGEKDGFLIQNIGDEHGSRDSRDGDYNYPSDKLIDFNPRCTEGHKAAANVMNNEVGTSRAHITEANPVPIRETHNNTADASNILRAPDENPSTKADEPENASSGSDDNIAFSALPHKRKPKLRSLADIINEEKNTTSEADLNPQPQLEVSLDVAKSTKTPQRKRKSIVLEEDRGPPETNPPIITAKRLKGSITEAENNSNNTWKRVEISESDSERDRPTRLDLRISSKTLPNKPRKQKALDINRKTMINAVHSANLQKYHVAVETSFGNMGPFFKNSLFGHQMDSISDVSKGKRPEEGDYSPYMPNIQEKVALDLSLSSYKGAEINSDNQESSGKHMGIPDLNESFVEKTYMTEGQQVPNLHETGSLALQENLDISASSSKDTSREGKRPMGASEHQPAVQNTDNNNTVVEHGGASDDIPMEIVELLAKNQRERALDNSRKHLVPDGIDNSFKGSSYYVESTPGPINFPYANARTGLSVPSGNIGVNQGFLNFPQSKNCRSDKSQFRQFGPLTLYSAPNSVVSGPRQRDGADLLWPPRRKNVTFGLSCTQNGSTQPNGLEDQSYKGKNVSYMKGDGKKAANDESLVKEGKIGPGRKSVGSIDAYSNDTIPAMQLLSLMDQGIVSGSSFKVGPNNILDRQFSPCNHHPRLNKNDNPFVSSSFFGQSSHTKDFPSLLNGVRYSGDSLYKSFSQGQMPPQKGNSKAIDLAGPSNLASQPSISDLTLGVCTLNRNPADFSIPDAKNEFTICAKDLKPKKRNSSKERSRPTSVEGPKRQRVRKDSARKESSRK